jgi:hypothetical protein
MRSHFCRIHDSPSQHRQSVEYNGELVVVASSTPRQDTLRYLQARGLRGEVVFQDGQTGTPRTVLRLPDASEKAREGRTTPESLARVPVTSTFPHPPRRALA